MKEKIKDKKKTKIKKEREIAPDPEITNIKRSPVKKITIGGKIEIQENNPILKNIEKDLIHLNNHQEIRYQDQNLLKVKKE